MSVTGKLRVEKVGEKSTATRCFSKYPLKFILPNKVGASGVDAVWIYTLTYGGGIVSGDRISCEFDICNGCTAVLTTQASTKVYKSLGSRCSEQFLEVLLEQGSISSIAECMLDYQVIAMVVLLGPKLKNIQNQVQENVRRLMSKELHMPFTGRRGSSSDGFDKPTFVASCSPFGPKGTGVVVRIAATTTESVYNFLNEQLSGLESLIGIAPYH
ncbi:Urease accessory protein D [Linum perenne]